MATSQLRRSLWQQDMRRNAVLLACAALALACCSAQTTGSAQWNFTRPLRVCFVSRSDFSSRCRGTSEALEAGPGPTQPPAPPSITSNVCPETSFCGFDVDVWRWVADAVGLVEDEDYVRVCLGSDQFEAMLTDLASNESDPLCDVAASTLTVTLERDLQGILFSRTTYRGALSILVLGEVHNVNPWSFLEPLHYTVWIALVATSLVIAVLAFVVDVLFAECSAYAMTEGTDDHIPGLKEAMWHSLAQTVGINFLSVTSGPARLILSAYGFLILIVMSTYSANLVAFMTKNRVDGKIGSVQDLYGQAVVTIPTYVSRLRHNQRMVVDSALGYDVEAMVSGLRRQEYAAVLLDNVALQPLAFSDPSCSVHLLSEQVESFDLAIGYHAGFDQQELMAAVDLELLRMQEDGVLNDLEVQHNNSFRRCIPNEDDSEDATALQLDSLAGVWYVYISSVMIASVYSIVVVTSSRQASDARSAGIRGRLQAHVSEVRKPIKVLSTKIQQLVGARSGLPAIHDSMPTAPYKPLTQPRSAAEMGAILELTLGNSCELCTSGAAHVAPASLDSKKRHTPAAPGLPMLPMLPRSVPSSPPMFHAFDLLWSNPCYAKGAERCPLAVDAVDRPPSCARTLEGSVSTADRQCTAIVDAADQLVSQTPLQGDLGLRNTSVSVLSASRERGLWPRAATCAHHVKVEETGLRCSSHARRSSELRPRCCVLVEDAAMGSELLTAHQYAEQLLWDVHGTMARIQEALRAVHDDAAFSNRSR